MPCRVLSDRSTEPVFSDPLALDRFAEQTCIGRNGWMSDIDGPLLFFVQMLQSM